MSGRKILDPTAYIYWPSYSSTSIINEIVYLFSIMTLINKSRSACDLQRLYMTGANHTLRRFTSLCRRIARTEFATGYLCPLQIVTCSTSTITSLGLSIALSPVFHRGRSDLLPGQFMWDLWWSKWRWDSFFFKYFNFPLPLSFHQCPTFIYLSLTDI